MEKYLTFWYNMKLLGLLVVVAVGGAVGGGVPEVTPTVGDIWPRPHLRNISHTYMVVDPSKFRIKSSASCPLIKKVISRFEDIIAKMQPGPQQGASKVEEDRVLPQIEILTGCSGEPMPHEFMDEQYEIKVDTPDMQSAGAQLISKTVWGAIRGLETFVQMLIPMEDGLLRVNSTLIRDFPRFTHRGFLIDSSRHYIPVPYIKQFIDLLSINKFNVLHWHIVDDPSFPYVSQEFPNLSAHGAFSPIHTYTAEDIADLVEYARERAIRIIAEFDTPGHTQSWGLGQKGLLTPCYDGSGHPNGNFGPVDPTNDANYDFMKGLLGEVTQVFPDSYVHLGGDEVNPACWKSNPEITAFMKEHNITTYNQLEAYYIDKVLNIVNALPGEKRTLVWEEVFNNGVPLANNSIVHVWYNRKTMNTASAKGYHVILSSCWYLNYIKYGRDWVKYYQCEPFQYIDTEDQKKLVLGGEAAMWGEFVDRTNLISRSFPRGSLVAEKLWSAMKDTQKTDTLAPRLQEHRCRMLARGYNVEPLGRSSYCVRGALGE